MKEIKGAKEKLSCDSKRQEAYNKYEKYQAMLKLYEQSDSGIEFVRNMKKPFRQAGKMAQENDFTLEEYEIFYHQVKKRKQDNPKIDMEDLITPQGRSMIAEIIAKSQYDRNFDASDLESVAVAKCYGLYKAMEECQGKENRERVKVLMDYQVGIGLYEAASKKMGPEKEEPANLVEIASTVLGIKPDEVKYDLVLYEVLKGKSQISEFDESIKVDFDYEWYKSDYDLINRCKERIQIIQNDERLTDKEKESLVNNEQKTIERTQKKIEEIKIKRAEQQKVVRGKYARNYIKIQGREEQEDPREAG